MHGWDLIGLSFAIFDVLRVDGMDAMCLPYADRRPLLEALELDGPPDGHPMRSRRVRRCCSATSVHGLEGIVAKKRSEPYRPGERAWVKIKNRGYWRFGQEMGAQSRRHTRLI